MREQDQGDLGYVSTGRSDLPAELVRAVFAVREVGAWCDEPVRVTQTVTVQVAACGDGNASGRWWAGTWCNCSTWRQRGWCRPRRCGAARYTG
ncbi:MAG: hypothetical protein R3A52_15135 [Polyangiales bacterium]